MPGRAPDPLSLAEDRTILAIERTFASWLRTGLAFLSVGLGLPRFLDGQFPRWQLRTIAVVLVLCAVASFASAAWRDHRSRRRIPEPEVHLLPAIVTLSAALSLVGVAILSEITLLWFL